MLVSPTPLYPVKRLYVPSTRDGTYFYRSRFQVFRFVRRCYTISTNISSCFFLNTLCSASDLRSVELQIILGDADVWDITLESMILFVKTVFDRTGIALQMDRSFVWHQYFGLNSCSNHFKFDSLTSYELSHF